MVDPAAQTDYVYNAVDNILAGMIELTDGDGNEIIAQTSPALIYPPLTPFLCAYPGGFSPAGQSVNIGDSSDYDQWGIILRYIAGPIGDGYLGGLEGKLWTWTRIMIKYLRSYPTLEYPLQAGGFTPEIPELSPLGVTVQGVSRFGVFNDDVTNLGFEITLIAPFVTDLERHW